MLNYPITIPRGNSYDTLGIGPEADPQEISDAELEASARLNAAKKELEGRIQQVFDRVEGLRAAYDLVTSLQGKEPVDAELLRKAQADLTRLEHEAERIEPSFKQHRERVHQLGREIEGLHRLKLQSAEDRQAYDRANPPLELLKLADPTKDRFATDPALMLTLVRRELAEFLSQQGEEVFHPTDLTRDDFSGDFTYMELLDERMP